MPGLGQARITDEHYSNYRTSVLVIFGEQSLRAETRSALLAFLAGPSRQLLMEQLGIDRSFCVRHQNVVDDNHRRDDLALATSMGVEVVAEGVKNETQYARLLNYGCRKFQGYLFGKPAEFG